MYKFDKKLMHCNGCRYLLLLAVEFLFHYYLIHNIIAITVTGYKLQDINYSPVTQRKKATDQKP